jgi:serine/threonine protein kinase
MQCRNWVSTNFPYSYPEFLASCSRVKLPRTCTLLTLSEPYDELKYNLEQLLQELYFDPDKVANFTQQDLTQLANLIGKLLRYDPSTRSTAAEILSEDWFRNV